MAETPENHPPLQPPDDDRRPPGRGGLLFLLLVFFTLFILVDIAILAYWLLPGRREPAVTPPPVETPAPASPAQPGPAEEKDARSTPRPDPDLQLARTTWLDIRAEAEAADVPSWGGDEYHRSLSLATAADTAAAGGRPVAAVRDYTAAATGLKKLLAARPALYARAMARGRQALDEGRAAAAREAFSRALAIRPADGLAARGLERAAGLEQVLAFMTEGAAAERQGELAQALAAYRRAAELDPEYEPARRAAERLQRQVEELRFRQAMGRFFTALDQNRLDRAAHALAEAAAIRPGDPAVGEGRSSLDRARQAAQLARLREEYRRHVRAEAWRQALAVCDRALAIAPDAAFAVAGRRVAAERLALDEAMAGILAHPLRLQEEGPLAEARQTLAVARAVADPGPRLQDGIRALARLLERATVPVPVTLRSDGATSVVIYRIGRLGRFTEKRISLRPGRYTVVGSRPGFRDVRFILEVDGDRPPAPLQVRCEEPI